jgi:glycerol kinase
MAGDQQAAMFGQACFEPGRTKTSYGTSAMVDLNAGSAPILSQHGAYPLVLWNLDEEPTYCLEGQVVTAGAALQWLRDGLGVIGSAAESDALARSVPDSEGVWAVPALQGLGTPYLDSGARAAIGGISRATTRAHVVRALLEGVAFRCREIVEALAADSSFGLPDVLRVDGGAAANDFLLQFQSDVLGIPVERPENLDAAASGAGFLAGLAVGFWSDLAEIASVWRLGARFEPGSSATERDKRYRRFQAIVAGLRAMPV